MHNLSFLGGASGKEPGGIEIWIQSLGREDSPGGGHGNPLQYSCLVNLVDRGAWRAVVHSIAESRT